MTLEKRMKTWEGFVKEKKERMESRRENRTRRCRGGWVHQSQRATEGRKAELLQALTAGEARLKEGIGWAA